jgi:hypothetical protein
MTSGSPYENSVGGELGSGVYYVGDIPDEVRLMTGAVALVIAREGLMRRLSSLRGKESLCSADR